MLGKLTYKLFKPFFLKYYYLDQSNKSGFEKMKKVFEQKKIREAMKKALGDGKKPNMAMIGHLIIEMDKREEMLLHPDSMFDLLAHRFVRSDEDPAIIDNKIHKEKIEQFRKDSMGGLYDFFYRMGLSAYMPYLTKLESEWSEYYRQSEIKITALNKQLNEYLSEAS
jgi:hypothetical protein